ncbi:MAG: hypothetical protein KIT44_11870 [Opitutaceae bacterium]|nr:hypothetical protein [Opitutaceae bacterium]
MSFSAATVSSRDFFRRASARETVVLLAVAWLVPFLVHVVPWSGSRPLGAHLLPMFWTAFVAVYLHGLRLGLVVALFAPALNLALTGLPALRWIGVLSFELTVFAVFVWWAVRRRPTLWLIAPAGYLVAKLAATGLQALLAVFGDLGAPSAFMLGSLRNALPGLMVLAAVNYALRKLYPKPLAAARDDAGGV